MEYHGKKTEVFLDIKSSLFMIGGLDFMESLILGNKKENNILVGYNIRTNESGLFRYYFDSEEDRAKFIMTYMD